MPLLGPPRRIIDCDEQKLARISPNGTDRMDGPLARKAEHQAARSPWIIRVEFDYLTLAKCLFQFRNRDFIRLTFPLRVL